VSITEQRKDTYSLSNPYYAIYQALVVRKGEAGKYRSLSDLKGKRVGAQIGATASMLVEKDGNAVLVYYDDNWLAAEGLLRGEVEAIVCDHPLAADFMRTNPAYTGKLAVTNRRLSSVSEPYGIVVKKGNTKVLDLINRGLSGLNPGVIPRLEKKWNMK